MVYKKVKNNGGFSLIELMVVMAIFVVISGITLFNYNKSSNSLVLTNLAYQAGIAIRQAQVYGISVKGVKVNGVTNYNSGYGVWFSPSTNQFTIFADVDGDGMYKLDNKEETFILPSLIKMKNICFASEVSGVVTKKCTRTGDFSDASITFKRPNPDATFRAFLYSNSDGNAYSHIEILFGSDKDEKVARLTVRNSGQISVDMCTDTSAGGASSCNK